jgi:hypothetical protein
MQLGSLGAVFVVATLAALLRRFRLAVELLAAGRRPPRTFTTRDGTTGVEPRLARDLSSRVPAGNGITRWMKVTAFGMLAERTAASADEGRPSHRDRR